MNHLLDRIAELSHREDLPVLLIGGHAVTSLGCPRSTFDIDLLIPHQANSRILDAAMESLGLPAEKVLMNLDRYGNTSAASIPLGIVDALEQGRIKPGDNVMMIGFGGGLTWGSCLFRW